MTTIMVGMLVYNIVLSMLFVALLVHIDQRLLHLEEDSHPPINLTPAMVDVLKALQVVCDRPAEGLVLLAPGGPPRGLRRTLGRGLEPVLPVQLER